MAAHAPLAPSSAPQWGHCSGSVQAQADIPDRESDQSREGTAAHWVMSETLVRARTMATAGLEPGTNCYDYVGFKAPNGVIIDDKMAEGAQVIVDDVAAVCFEFDAWVDLLIEQRVYVPSIHPENWGTTDVALYLPQQGVMFDWDYKHGHRENRAEGNLQAVDYVAGLCERFGIDGLAQQHTRFVIRIVQPFCYHARGPVSEWSGMLTDLRPYWNQLAQKADEAYRNPTLTTGLWCRDCKAAWKCSARRRADYSLIDLANEPYEMDDMSGADLAVEREILRDGVAVARARLEAIEDELQHRIKAGRADSGLTVETTQGRLEWSVPPVQVRALASQFGVDASKDAVMTPAQTLAAADRKLRPLLQQTMEHATRRKAGALKLVEADESRTARAFRRN